MTYKSPPKRLVRRADLLLTAPPPPAPPAPEHVGTRFGQLSATLTGFSEVELAETGSGARYASWLHESFPDVLSELLATWSEISQSSPPDQWQSRLVATVLPDPRLGPFARAVTHLWYTATWTQMPAEWRAEFGARDSDQVRVFGTAYLAALAWRAGGIHPQGGRATGYASWSLPPAEMP
jgi:hypothetical protein